MGGAARGRPRGNAYRTTGCGAGWRGLGGVSEDRAGFEDGRHRCHHVRTMSEESLPNEPRAGAEPVEVGAEPVEVVEGVPVLAEVRPLAPASPATLPAVQAAAAAATGFVAGAATLALLHRRSGRRLARVQRSLPQRAADTLPVLATRTFLVDVHLIAKPGE